MAMLSAQLVGGKSQEWISLQGLSESFSQSFPGHVFCRCFQWGKSSTLPNSSSLILPSSMHKWHIAGFRRSLGLWPFSTKWTGVQVAVHLRRPIRGSLLINPWPRWGLGRKEACLDFRRVADTTHPCMQIELILSAQFVNSFELLAVKILPSCHRADSISLATTLTETLHSHAVWLGIFKRFNSFSCEFILMASWALLRGWRYAVAALAANDFIQVPCPLSRWAR